MMKDHHNKQHWLKEVIIEVFKHVIIHALIEVSWHLIQLWLGLG